MCKCKFTSAIYQHRRCLCDNCPGNQRGKPLELGRYSGELLQSVDHTTTQYVALPETNDDLMISADKQNRCKVAELSRSEELSRSVIDLDVGSGTEVDDTCMEPWFEDPTRLCKPFCNGRNRSMVLETDENNASVDYNQEELVHNANESCTSCLIDFTQISELMEPVEEASDKADGVDVVSQLRASKGANIPNEETDSRGIRPFMSLDDGTAHNETTVGIFSSDNRTFNYSNYSYKSMIVGNSGLASVYCETDKPHKPQDHLLTLPHLASSTDDGKHLVIGIVNCLFHYQF